MKRLQRVVAAAWLLGLAMLAPPAMAGVVVVAHANMHKLDLPTLQRIYTGKVIEVGGVSVSPINLKAGQPLRQRFLADYLQQDEDKFVAYWTVRRYVGKGTPPREVKDAAAMVEQINKTPGAIGYVDESDVTPGMNVLLRK